MRPITRPPTSLRRAASRPEILPSLLAWLVWLCLPLAATAAEPTAAHGASMAADGASMAQPGPYAVETREVEVSRPVEAGGAFDARLYIPLAPQAADAGAAPERSPIVAFGHGFLTPVSLYDSTLAHLASWGITTIAPLSAAGPLPDHAAFAADLSAAAEWVATEAGGASDWPGLPVDPAARGLSGHSMGGGAAILAAASDQRIASLATLAAADTRPSAITAAAELEVAALFVAGSDDAITPVDAHQRPMYEAVSAAPAQLRIIEGGSHCGFLDVEILPGIVCDEGGVDLDEQRAHTRAALASWFRTHLMRDTGAAEVAWPDGSPDGISIEAAGVERGT